MLPDCFALLSVAAGVSALLIAVAGAIATLRKCRYDFRSAWRHFWSASIWRLSL